MNEQTRKIFWPDHDGTVWTGEVPSDALELDIGWSCPHHPDRKVCLIDNAAEKFTCCPHGQVRGDELEHPIPNRHVNFVAPCPPTFTHARAVVYTGKAISYIPLEVA